MINESFQEKYDKIKFLAQNEYIEATSLLKHELQIRLHEFTPQADLTEHIAKMKVVQKKVTQAKKSLKAWAEAIEVYEEVKKEADRIASNFKISL